MHFIGPLFTISEGAIAPSAPPPPAYAPGSDMNVTHSSVDSVRRWHLFEISLLYFRPSTCGRHRCSSFDTTYGEDAGHRDGDSENGNWAGERRRTAPPSRCGQRRKDGRRDILGVQDYHPTGRRRRTVRGNRRRPAERPRTKVRRDITCQVEL